MTVAASAAAVPVVKHCKMIEGESKPVEILDVQDRPHLPQTTYKTGVSPTKVYFIRSLPLAHYSCVISSLSNISSGISTASEIHKKHQIRINPVPTETISNLDNQNGFDSSHYTVPSIRPNRNHKTENIDAKLEHRPSDVA